MQRSSLILQTVLFTLLFVVVVWAVLYCNRFFEFLGPVTLGVFMEALLLLCISFNERYRQARRAALLAFITGVVFLIGYVIMCLRTGRDISLLGFLFHFISLN